MSLFLLTRSFHLHLLSLFCFQAALFFCPFPRTDINRWSFFIYWYLLLQARHFFLHNHFLSKTIV